MKRLFLLCSALLTLIAPLIVRAQNQIPLATIQDSGSGTQDVESFAAELRRLSDTLAKNPSGQRLATLRDSLPQYWIVKASGNSYSISSEFLKRQLSSGANGLAKAWVDHLVLELQSYSVAHPTSEGNPRGELDKILAGSEFAAVHQPSAWELFRQRLAAWVNRLLLRIFGGLARYPIGGQILFWLVLLAGVGFIALWLFRFMAGRDRMDSLPLGEIAGASRTWQEWIQMAREAAKRDDFRNAVHSAYWAGIARLEDVGVVPRDRTKTPREYLRLVTQPSELETTPIPIYVYREPLAELTRRFERIWYANRGAGPEDFQQTLQQLEAMGCQLG
jgi:Domain of unknown function (DUF4129)